VTGVTEGGQMGTADVAATLNAEGLAAARSDAAREAAGMEAARDWRGLAATRRRQGEFARAVGALDEAEVHLRAALSLYVMLEDSYKAGRVLAFLAEVRLALGDAQGAADLSRQAADRVPGDTEALTVLAYAEWAAGSASDAEVTFSEALRWDADAALALSGRGQVRAGRGSYDAALDDLDRALKLGLNEAAEAEARSARALALAGLGRAGDALAELERSAPRGPRAQLWAERTRGLTGSSGEAPHGDGAGSAGEGGESRS
jgi:tetratricopeptide (TPR) repeat protein